MAELLSTYRDRVKLHENGYLYVFDKMSSNGEKKFWRCEKKSECSARVHTDAATNLIIKRTSEHNHPRNSSLVQACKLRSVLKRRSIESVEKPVERTREVSVLDSIQPTQLDEQSATLRTMSTNETLNSLLQRAENSLRNGLALSPIQEENENSIDNDATDGTNKKRKIPGASVSTALDSSSSLQSIFYNLPSTSGTEGLLIKQEVPENSINEQNETTFEGCIVKNGSQVPLRTLLVPKRYSPKNGVVVNEIDRFLSRGFITWSPQVSEVTRLGDLVVRVVCHSEAKNYGSLLLTGPANSGTSCMAAVIAKQSGIGTVRMCLPESMVGLNEMARVNSLKKMFEDAYKNMISVIFIDNIDRIIDYCHVGDRFSNTILQTLMVLLKKLPPTNHRLFLIATAGSRCAEAFDLHSLFTITAEMPLLTEVEHLMNVIEGTLIFDVPQCEILRQLLKEHCTSCSIGIKKLLDLLELTKQCDPLQRVVFLYQKLKSFM